MNNLLPRKAHALVWLLVAGAGLTAVGAGARLVWVYVGRGVSLPLETAAMGTFDGSPNYGPILVRAGLDSDVLAAAGVSSGNVGSIVSVAATEAALQSSAINSADSSIRAAKQTVDRLSRVVQAGSATDQQKSDLGAAQSTLASATSARNTALTAVFNAGVGQMSESQSRIATRIRANRSWGLPLHHLAADPGSRTEADWVALRDAISCKSACDHCGEDVPSDATSTIAASEVITDINSAKTGLINNTATVATAWNSAVNGG